MIVNKLIELLESLSYEVYQQGSFTDTKKYPDSFFTFWNDETESKSIYDNNENLIVWNFTLYFYSTSPLLPYEVILKAKSLLKSHGFIINGLGEDIATDSKNHSGRMITAKYIENIGG